MWNQASNPLSFVNLIAQVEAKAIGKGKHFTGWWRVNYNKSREGE